MNKQYLICVFVCMCVCVCVCVYVSSRPYNNRSKFDKSPPMDGEEKSVFKRLGGQSSSGGSIFTRLSGIGGASKFTDRGESWHKISVCCIAYRFCYLIVTCLLYS